MKNLILVVLFIVSLMVYAVRAGQWTPQSGNPGHVEPPKDWICSNDHRAPPDHKCDCEHKCVANQPQTNCDDIGENCTTTPAEPGMHVEENAKCKVWCFPKHCGCSVKGCDTT